MQADGSDAVEAGGEEGGRVSALDALSPLPGRESIKRGSGRPKSYTVPVSSTGITNRFGDKGAIIGAANKVGRAGLTLNEAWGSAKIIGSLVHDSIQAAIHGDPMPEVPEEFRKPVESSLAAWWHWYAGTTLRIEYTEWPLVCEEHQFGGTIDAVVRDHEDRLCIADWKTSSGIFPEMLWQVASYGHLWDVNNEEKITGGFYVLRFDKEDGHLMYQHYPELDDALELFLLLRRAYDLDKRVGKRAK